MLKNESTGYKLFNIFNVSGLLFLSFITLYPMLYVAFASLSVPQKFMAFDGILIKPLGFYTEGYRLLFKNPMLVKGYVNTIFVLVTGVMLNILLTSLGAYFLSRKGLLLKKPIMLFIVFTMYFNGGLIPFYFTVKQLGLDNTLWALIFPVAVNTMNLIIMRTAFMAIPDSMEESARIDGASHFIVLFRIIIPLSLPTIAVMILYYGVAHWNAWFNAMLFLRKRDMFPLQLVLREILIQNDTNEWSVGVDTGAQEAVGEIIKYAIIIVASVPILTLYPFLQKYFIKGVMIGALKE